MSSSFNFCVIRVIVPCDDHIPCIIYQPDSCIFGFLQGPTNHSAHDGHVQTFYAAVILRFFLAIFVPVPFDFRGL
jgi:hypothetical protein